MNLDLKLTEDNLFISQAGDICVLTLKSETFDFNELKQLIGNDINLSLKVEKKVKNTLEIGMTIDEVRIFFNANPNMKFRIVKLDGRNFVITHEFDPSRYNLEFENNILTNITLG